jgi:hypothetical protein
VATVAVPGSVGGTYPQVLASSDSAAVVAYTVAGATRPEVRLARVSLPRP